jgi:hypothetical protein
MLVESPISEEIFIREWRESEAKGLTHLILVTANRLRLGKTYAAIRIGELLDPHFTIDNIGFETAWFVEQADKSERGSILVLDEPNRAAGNRSWYTEENRGFAEYLQTNAYRGIHGLFPLPHQHLMDNAVTGVCTAQIVMDSPGHAFVYTFDRDQLNRSYSTYTPNWGELLLKRPDAKLCHAYEKKRDEYTRERNRQFLKLLQAAVEVTKRPSSKEMVEQIITGGWSTAGEIQEGLGINRTMAYDLLKRAKHEAMKRKIVDVSP